MSMSIEESWKQQFKIKLVNKIIAVLEKSQ